ncbi:MAG: PUR family DNA/RNA-binding protein [Bacteroides sp.]|nr:PUR family DNA/RNA-binding protein [Bacteroides sp.]
MWKNKKKKNPTDIHDKEIVFSKAIKAGKRIYYLDVKKNRKDEMFLAITESKKIVYGEGEDAQVSFEKHKIFLYKEDFDKFMTGLTQAVDYIQSHQGAIYQAQEEVRCIPEVQETSQEKNENDLGSEIKIDIEF